jgi:hypothetical protein
MNKNSINKILLFSVPVAATGCANRELITAETVQSGILDDSEILKMELLKDPSRNRIGEVIDDFYVSKKAHKSIKSKATGYPIEFYKKFNISIPDIGLDFLLAYIYKSSGVTVRFDPSDLSVLVGEGGRTDHNTNGNGVITDEGAYAEEVRGSALPDPEDVRATNAYGETEGVMSNISTADVRFETMQFNGNLAEFLDFISVKVNLKWNYDSVTNEVYFYSKRAEVFYVNISTKIFKKSNTITTNTSTSVDGGGAGDDQSKTASLVTQSITDDPWTNILDTVRSVVGESGEVVGFKSQKKIIVKSGDFQLSKVREFIEGVNYDANNQILVKVEVSNLSTTDSDNFNIDVNYINNIMSSKILGLDTFALSAANAVTGSLPGFGGTTDGSTNNAGELIKGVDITGEVLSGFGTVSRDSLQQFLVKNNTPYAMQLTQNTSYVKSISVEESDEGDETTSTEIGEIADGITYLFTPSVYENNINLEISTSISNLDKLETAPGNDQVQLPLTSKKGISQEVNLSDGVPRIVSILEVDTKKSNKQGPLSSSLFFLGGSRSHAVKKEYLIVTVTAYKQKIKN